MAKKMVSKKSVDRTAPLVALISKIQERLTTVTNDTNAALVQIKLESDRAWQLGNSREAVASKNREEIEKFGKNTTASMYALRDSTQKAFNNTSGDITALKTSLQRLNERMGQAESRISRLESDVKVLNDFRTFIQEIAKGLLVPDTVGIHKR